MPHHDDGWTTRDATAVRDRIADILGYCNRNGELHNPQNFEKKLLRSKWVCPDCSTVAGKVAYKRANELQWTLVRPEGTEGTGRTTAEDESTDGGETDDESEDDVQADEEPDVDGAEQGDTDENDDADDVGGIGGTDSEDVKARIENAQEDIEEFEEAAEQ